MDYWLFLIFSILFIGLSNLCKAASFLPVKETKKQWIKPWRNVRVERGSFSFLKNELLLTDEASYKNYLRMSEEQFKFVLNLVQQDIRRADTPMRDAISPAEKLAITLRFLATDLRNVCCLFVTDLNVPEIVDFRDNVTLSCSYALSGHTLNSVKWYKDKMEFFRYSPMMHPVYIKFPVVGVHMPDGKYFCNESSCKVELSMLSAKSSGVYKCEVSGDAPNFQLAAKEDNMTVAALPQSDPLIESFNPMYRMEDYLSAICTSDYSSLLTKLTWFINGEQASLGELQPNVDTSISAHGYILRRQKLQVHFYLSGPRFYQAGKILQLKCIAEIENYPELTRETSLNAALIPYDNLNNQMLIHAGTNGGSSSSTLAATINNTIIFNIVMVIFSTILSTSTL